MYPGARVPKYLRAQRGVTLLEILIAMLLLGMVTAGIMGAFVFSRQLAWRSHAELAASAMAQGLSDRLRLAVGAAAPDGLVLDPGIYVDDFMATPPPGAIQLDPPGPLGNPLNPPDDFRTRFLTGPTDGIYMYVENSDENDNGIGDEDLDSDGLIGLDFDDPPDFSTDLRRVRIRVEWTSPSVS